MRSLVDKTRNEFPALRVEWDSEWSDGVGRLRVLFPPENSAGIVAAGMVTLINETSSIIDAAIRKTNSHPASRK